MTVKELIAEKGTGEREHWKLTTVSDEQATTANYDFRYLVAQEASINKDTINFLRAARKSDDSGFGVLFRVKTPKGVVTNNKRGPVIMGSLGKGHNPR